MFQGDDFSVSQNVSFTFYAGGPIGGPKEASEEIITSAEEYKKWLGDIDKKYQPLHDHLGGVDFDREMLVGIALGTVQLGTTVSVASILTSGGGAGPLAWTFISYLVYDPGPAIEPVGEPYAVVKCRKFNPGNVRFQRFDVKGEGPATAAIAPEKPPHISTLKDGEETIFTTLSLGEEDPITDRAGEGPSTLEYGEETVFSTLGIGEEDPPVIMDIAGEDKPPVTKKEGEAPPHISTFEFGEETVFSTLAVGEEDPPKTDDADARPPISTFKSGEETIFTTLALGEEHPPITTDAVGEEDPPTTDRVGEGPPPLSTLIAGEETIFTTLALGEEDHPTTHLLGEEHPHTTLAIGEEYPPVNQAGAATTLAAGEESEAKPPPTTMAGAEEFSAASAEAQFTTLVVGEEGPGPTTLAVGEEGGTTKMFGEEGFPTTHLLGEEQPHTTDAVGEENPTTLMVGEEGGGTTHLMGEEIPMTTLAVGEEDPGGGSSSGSPFGSF
jgi:hypothetical protein